MIVVISDTKLADVAVPNGDGLRGIPAPEPGRTRRGRRTGPSRTRGWTRWSAQHQPRVHALLVRAGGSVRALQTEPGSST